VVNPLSLAAHAFERSFPLNRLYREYDIQFRPPTETDKVQAMMNYSKLKKQANQNLVQSLRQQLANAEASVK